MNIAGLTVAYTQAGAEIIDGACCLYHDNNIHALAEERVSRQKHQSGSQSALQYLCQRLDLTFDDIDYFCLSSCGEPPLTPNATLSISKKNLWSLQDMGIAEEKIIINPSHHLAHAFCGYYSQYEGSLANSLVIVLDYHGNSGEKNSYYLFDKNNYHLLHRDHEGLSIGGVYHEVADLLGYDGATQCGTLMALAGLSRSNPLMPPLLVGDGVQTHATFAKKSLFDYLQNINSDLYLKLPQAIEAHHVTQYSEKTQFLDENILALADAVQHQMQLRLLDVIKVIRAKQIFSKVIICGGVASNCKLLGFLQNELDGMAVHGCYAPGDTSQAIGNVIYVLKAQRLSIPTQFISPFLGPKYTIDKSWVRNICKKHDLHIYKENATKIMAQLLCDGRLVACFNGRSEFGQRALGNRSILAHPGNKELKHKLNHQIKNRQWFRPYGAVFLQEYVEQVVPGTSKSYYMDLTGTIAELWQERLAAICHLDGTTRVQSIAKDMQPEYLYKLLCEFYKLTNLPCLLNTSLNEGNQPIVETPQQAINLFVKKDLDAIYIGNELLVRRRSEPKN